MWNPQETDRLERLFSPRERAFSRRGVFGGNYTSPNPAPPHRPVRPAGPVVPPKPVHTPFPVPEPPRYPVEYPSPFEPGPFGKRAAKQYRRGMKFVPGIGYILIGTEVASYFLFVPGVPFAFGMPSPWFKVCGFTRAPAAYGQDQPKVQWYNFGNPSSFCGLGAQALPGGSNVTPLGQPAPVGNYRKLWLLSGPDANNRYFINEEWSRPLAGIVPQTPVYQPPLPYTVIPPFSIPDAPVIPDLPYPLPHPQTPGDTIPDPVRPRVPYPVLPHVPPVFPSVRTNGDSRSSGPGGGNRPKDPTVRRPTKGTKEVKTKWSPAKQLLWDLFKFTQKILHSTTEWNDFLDCFSDTPGFPKHLNPALQVKWLFQNADRIAWQTVLNNFAENYIEDLVIGYVMSKVPWQVGTVSRPDLEWADKPRPNYWI